MASQNTPVPRHRQVWLQTADPEIRLHYVECLPTTGGEPKGTILLIHGFPETSYQFRHVTVPFAEAGYRVIAPDYRGAGYSSCPPDGYTKAVLAQDLYRLVTEHAGVKEPIHVVGSDIGGMIAHAYVAQFPSHVASVVWGECLLPGSRFYEDYKHSPPLWHWDFQAQSDIAVSLVTGKEKMYLKDFYGRFTQNPHAFSNEDVDFYAMQYSMPGALRCAFEVYRMFETDAEHNREWLKKNGKVEVRSMVLNGEHVFWTASALEMASEMYSSVEAGVVEGSGHFIAAENPKDFVKKILEFVEKK